MLNLLPDVLISKINLYNSTPLSDMIKIYWKKLNDKHNIYYDIKQTDTGYNMFAIDYPRIFFEYKQINLPNNLIINFIDDYTIDNDEDEFIYIGNINITI